MPYIEHAASLDSIKRKIRRIVLNGPPNSRKTSSIRTLPGDVKVISYPKEKGTASLPTTNVEGKSVVAYTWEQLDVSKPQPWTAIVKETWALTAEILTGQKGPCTAFVGDGIHKWYQVILASFVNGANFTGEEDFEPRVYVRSHAKFWEYVDMVFHSSLDWVVLTCWDGLEADNPDDVRPKNDGGKGSSASRHIYPDLPGQAAKKIMGETSLALHAGQDGSGDQARHFWQTRPGGRVWGAGLKLPIDLIMKGVTVPREVPQDFAALDALIMKQVEAQFKPRGA